MELVYDVYVLFNGYSEINVSGTEMKANCSCTLLKGIYNIIIDTMTAWDGENIIEALLKLDLKPDDINWVVCTHGHSDHIGNNYLFKNATHIVGTSISKYDKYFIHDFDKQPEYIIDKNVKIIATPGHTLSCISVIAQTKTNGVVSIVGDLFEKFADIKNENVWLDAGSECPDKQRINRKYILNISDFIIPGHGPMFKVTKEIKDFIN